MRCIMCKDKRMLALIVAIFISVLLITGWVFADHTVIDLIGATPILNIQETDPAPAAEAVVPSVTDGSGMCLVAAGCE